MTIESFYETTLDKLLKTQALINPNLPFLKHEGGVWTYEQVDHLANEIASSLQKLDLLPGDRLGAILPNIPEYVITLFAAARAGLILLPINTRRHSTEVLARLKKGQPKAVITFADPKVWDGINHLEMVIELQNDVPGLEYIISTSESEEESVIHWEALLGRADEASQFHQANPEDPAVIAFTLGSSGNPRGAILSHRSLILNAAQIAKNLACIPGDVFLGAVPFSNTFGLTPTILSCMVSGAELVCLPKYTPRDSLKLIEKEKVTVHHGVPTMFALELNQPEFDPKACASLRTGIMSGAPCPPELVKRVREEMNMTLVLAYGLTEASPSVTMTRLDDGPVTATETVGRPHEGVELKVVDLEGNTLSHGEVGELCVRGYNLMLGYWDDLEETQKVIDDGGWLHTGDLAMIMEDGPVQIVGRKDEVINRGGFKIYPGNVEMVVRSYPGVKEAAVVGIPDLIYGELPSACVVRSPGADFTSEDVLEFLSERLADYAVPDRVLFFDALPRRGGGPVNKKYLRERVRIRGKAWKFGKNIDTDAIIPARRCNTADPKELALYCMEDADPDFINKMNRGDLIVADTNFGCGSSREVAPLSIKAAGVSAVIAKSFARIFFRNAINIGLPILECPEAVDGILEGDDIEVEPAAGTIRNLSQGVTYSAEPFPDFLQRIIDRGGLLAYVEERVAGGEV